MQRMILVETDNDLAELVASFFCDRYKVTRIEDLSQALAASIQEQAALLFADVGTGSHDQLSVLERLKQDHPEMKIVVTYLAPLDEVAWEKRLHESADVLVRKPYGVLDVDKELRKLDEKNGSHLN